MSPRNKIESTMYFSLLGYFLKKPNYGYELYKFLSNETVFFKIWFVKQSQFYGYLERLFNEGYLSHELIEGEQYPDRRIFSITELGNQTLENWIISPVNHGREMRQEFLVKLFIAQNSYKEKIDILINNQKIICNQWIDEQDENLKNEDDKFQLLIINYRKMQIEAMINWLNLVQII
ncbi:MAG: helix-turn-helix transcriptional regulator [Anaerolineaceae bacterium]|nr:helix-turn-helix transcriptional regulator [Anaerolineaceae bacterium]